MPFWWAGATLSRNSSPPPFFFFWSGSPSARPRQNRRPGAAQFSSERVWGVEDASGIFLFLLRARRRLFFSRQRFPPTPREWASFSFSDCNPFFLCAARPLFFSDGSALFPPPHQNVPMGFRSGRRRDRPSPPAAFGQRPFERPGFGRADWWSFSSRTAISAGAFPSPPPGSGQILSRRKDVDRVCIFSCAGRIPFQFSFGLRGPGALVTLSFFFSGTMEFFSFPFFLLGNGRPGGSVGLPPPGTMAFSPTSLSSMTLVISGLHVFGARLFVLEMSLAVSDDGQLSSPLLSAPSRQ